VKNPYLEDRRLENVIAALTAMGAYPFYKQTAAEWSDRISGNKDRADCWKIIFEQHPEFFRRASTEADYSLVWRRQFPRSFDVRDLKETFPDHYVEKTSRDPIGRRPLEPGELTQLIGVAIRLHESALEHRKAGTWWVPLAAAVLAFAGAVVGGVIRH